MKSEYNGSILAVRAVEDAIRATRKYTKGAFSRRAKHPQTPVQGDAPSAVLTEYYEVYPDTDLEEILPLGKAFWETLAWLGGAIPHVDVRFLYDYRGGDKAKVVIWGGNGVIQALENGIPGFTEALAAVKVNSGGDAS